MRIIFQDVAWQDYLHWQQNDKAILKKLNTIIKRLKELRMKDKESLNN